MEKRNEFLPVCDWVKVKVLVDNAVDEFLPSTEGVERFRFIRRGYHELPPPIRAEHGLSLILRWMVSGREHCLLFDFGLSADALPNNLRAMGESLDEVEALVLSHGHWDHFGGLVELGLKAPTTLYHGPQAMLQHRIGPAGNEVDVGQVKREWLDRQAIAPVEITQATEILPGALLTGPIPRVTAFEGGTGPFQVRTADGWVSDSFPGEMGLVFRTGRGLVVLSGCAHAGIVNTAKYAQKLVGNEPVHAIMGGFHLITSPAEVVEATIGGFRELEPDVLIPTHCTGQMATIAIAGSFKEAYRVSSVGTTWSFPLQQAG